MPTEDGWEPSPRIEPDSPLLVWKTVPGTDVTMQVRNDNVGTLMLAYAADYHAYVEPLVDRMTACYTPTNSVSTSNHLNATAMDFNWDYYPWKQRGNLTGDKLQRLRDLLAFYDPWMFWAGDWDDAYVDEMHHQMNYGSYPLAMRGDLAQWIKTHIRPDGFSTYRRDMDPKTTAITALYDAVPFIDMTRAGQLVDEVMQGLALSECNNPNRIAMWLAQIGWESDNFNATEEYAKNGSYAPYIGRTWIQITWQSNYADFGKWCAARGLIDDPNFFVANPQALADPKWASIGPAWYWTVQRPQINGLCDAGDLVGVTKAINGGTNGLEDPNPNVPGRRSRYNQALALGDRLMALVQTVSEPPAQDGETVTIEVPKAQWDQLVSDVKEIRSQLNGDGVWPQTGNDPDAIQKLEDLKASGKPMSLLDMVRWTMLHASTHKDPRP